MKAAGFDFGKLEACFSPAAPAAEAAPEREKESLVAAIREVMAAPETAASSGASTAAAEAVPTAFALLSTDQRARLASSEEVAAAVSTISSQVFALQRNDFVALTDKEFRDHFAGLLNV